MSKKLPIYFSDDAWSSLQELMGPEGKPSPTINTVLEQIAVQNELVEKLGLTEGALKSLKYRGASGEKLLEQARLKCLAEGYELHFEGKSSYPYLRKIKQKRA